MKAFVKSGLLLASVALCLFEYVLDRQSTMFHESNSALLQTQWMLLACLAVWCSTFLFLTFSLTDLPLIGLLLIAIVAYFISLAENRPATDAVIFLFGVTLGKGVRFTLKSEKWKAESENNSSLVTRHPPLVTFQVGLVLLLAFSALWHLNMTNNFYHGPRWMGLWNNPNDYGLLMAAGLVLAVGLLAAKRRKGNSDFATKEHGEHKEQKRKAESGKRNFLRSLRSFAAIDSVILLVAVLMMGTGLLFSYSRGSWLGTAIGLLYLARAREKFKWWFVLPGFFIAAAVAWFFWNSTPDTAPWYLKRLDLSRPSAQHRVAAWCGALQMMRDHPFGVGWNKAVGIYQKNYSPPEGGAAAITTNDYLMLGTQLGWPGLVCFVAYVALCFRNRPGFVAADVRRLHLKSGMSEPPHVGSYDSTENGEGIATSPVTRHWSPSAACRSAALAMAVAFWFDGGLFKLATASVFWILLELGAETQKRKAEGGKVETD